MDCITPGCGRSAFSRGLCSACYYAAFRLIKEGKTTWDELEKRGLSAPPRKNRPHTAAFMKAFEKNED